jgi:DNA-binding CsgD family transcriptional regulator
MGAGLRGYRGDAEREEAAMEERHATLHVLPPPARPQEQVAEPRPGVERGRGVRAHVVGADPLARVGIRTLLTGHRGISVTGESASGPDLAPHVSRVDPDRLTERECQVLELLARGLSNGEIAESLTLSPHTVKTHARNMLHKLRLPSRVHAAVYAFETGVRRPRC